MSWNRWKTRVLGGLLTLAAAGGCKQQLFLGPDDWQQAVTAGLPKPLAAQFLTFQQQRDVANFSSTLAKPLPTGGVAGITFSVDYSKFGQIPASQQNNFVNPNYTPRLSFAFEQPLLQGFGVEINQL